MGAGGWVGGWVGVCVCELWSAVQVTVMKLPPQTSPPPRAIADQVCRKNIGQAHDMFLRRGKAEVLKVRQTPKAATCCVNRGGGVAALASVRVLLVSTTVAHAVSAKHTPPEPPSPARARKSEVNEAQMQSRRSAKMLAKRI